MVNQEKKMRRSRKVAENHNNKPGPRVVRIRAMVALRKEMNEILSTYVWRYFRTRDIESLKRFNNKFKKWMKEQ